MQARGATRIANSRRIDNLSRIKVQAVASENPYFTLIPKVSYAWNVTCARISNVLNIIANNMRDG